jgi:hypothetical protein
VLSVLLLVGGLFGYWQYEKLMNSYIIISPTEMVTGGPARDTVHDTNKVGKEAKEAGGDADAEVAKYMAFNLRTVKSLDPATGRMPTAYKFNMWELKKKKDSTKALENILTKLQTVVRKVGEGDSSKPKGDAFLEPQSLVDTSATKLKKECLADSLGGVGNLPGHPWTTLSPKSMAADWDRICEKWDLLSKNDNTKNGREGKLARMETDGEGRSDRKWVSPNLSNKAPTYDNFKDGKVMQKYFARMFKSLDAEQVANVCSDSKVRQKMKEWQVDGSERSKLMNENTGAVEEIVSATEEFINRQLAEGTFQGRLFHTTKYSGLKAKNLLQNDAQEIPASEQKEYFALAYDGRVRSPGKGVEVPVPIVHVDSNSIHLIANHISKAPRVLSPEILTKRGKAIARVQKHLGEKMRGYLLDDKERMTPLDSFGASDGLVKGAFNMWMKIEDENNDCSLFFADTTPIMVDSKSGSNGTMSPEYYFYSGTDNKDLRVAMVNQKGIDKVTDFYGDLNMEPGDVYLFETAGANAVAHTAAIRIRNAKTACDRRSSFEARFVILPKKDFPELFAIN